MISKLQSEDTSIIKALRERGYKATPQRIAVGRFVLNNSNHPTVQKIHNEVKKIHPTVSLATVYKTIRILRDVGLIQELNLPQDQTRFDSDMRPHINLICLKCGKIKDLRESSINEMISRISSSESFSPTGQRFDIYGICQRCNKREYAARQDRLHEPVKGSYEV